MRLDPRRQRLHLCRQRRQRRGVALRQLAHAPGERLRHALDLGLQRSGERGEPLVVDDERLAKYAGVKKYRYGETDKEDQVGIITGLAYTPDGSALITAGGDGSVRLWDAARLPDVRDLYGQQARLVTLGRHEGGCRAIDLSADGTTLVSAGGDGLVHVWRLADR